MLDKGPVKDYLAGTRYSDYSVKAYSLPKRIAIITGIRCPRIHRQIPSLNSDLTCFIQGQIYFASIVFQGFKQRGLVEKVANV